MASLIANVIKASSPRAARKGRTYGRTAPVQAVSDTVVLSFVLTRWYGIREAQLFPAKNSLESIRGSSVNDFVHAT
jgi:hypothetical protein